MKRVSWFINIFLALLDLGLVMASFFVATLLKYGSLNHPYFSSRPLIALLIAILSLFAVVAYVVGFYKEKRGIFYELDEVGTIILGCTITALALVLFTFFTKEGLYSRRVVVYAWIFSMVMISAAHLIFMKIKHWFYQKEIGSKKIIIVGEGKESSAIIKKIESFPIMGYQIAGRDTGQDLIALEKEIISLRPDGVIIALQKDEYYRLTDILRICEEHQLEIWVVPGVLELIARKVEIDDVDGIPLINLKGPATLVMQYLLKRCFDLICSLALIVIVSPLLVITAILIKITSPGPVIFTQKRIGLNGQPFYFLKFRTMYKDAESKLDDTMKEKGSRSVFIKIKDDPRITPLGKWLRRFSVDELPQLFNVLKGEMSLVGPRPLFAKGVDNSTAWMRKRLRAKPGITGLWQISGRSECSDEESVMLDIYYIEHWSFWLDIKILIYTLPAVAIAKGAY
jgi:exopolysaccharide biosynthesis polyprenyl glycosylphosphotransferase